MSIDFDTRNLPTDQEIERMFNAVPVLERHKVADKTVRAGATPIVKRARQLAPRSSKTGTADKRSRNQQAQADWSTPLWKTIAMVVRKYSSNAAAIIGPRWPDGNKAYFNTSPAGRRKWLWGRDTGQIVPQVRNWIVQAFDETRAEQLAAMKRKLKSLMDEVWRG